MDTSVENYVVSDINDITKMTKEERKKKFENWYFNEIQPFGPNDGRNMQSVTDLVFAEDGYLYELNYIKEYQAKNKKSPKTGSPMGDIFIRSKDMTELVNAFRQENYPNIAMLKTPFKWGEVDKYEGKYLFEQILQGNTEYTIDQVIELGIESNYRDGALLRYAIDQQDPQMIDKIIKLGANIKICEYSLLIHAAKVNIGIFTHLLTKINNLEPAAFMKIVNSFDDIENLMLVISSIISVFPNYLNEIFINAVKEGKEEMLNLMFIQYGNLIDINHLLEISLSELNMKAIKFFKRNGAVVKDINNIVFKKEIDDDTTEQLLALKIFTKEDLVARAIKSGNYELLKSMLDRGAEFTSENYKDVIIKQDTALICLTAEKYSSFFTEEIFNMMIENLYYISLRFIIRLLKAILALKSATEVKIRFPDNKLFKVDFIKDIIENAQYKDCTDPENRYRRFGALIVLYDFLDRDNYILLLDHIQHRNIGLITEFFDEHKVDIFSQDQRNYFMRYANEIDRIYPTVTTKKMISILEKYVKV